jgi:tRNA A-37 threonylcarbamoyl transferase component Bud32
MQVESLGRYRIERELGRGAMGRVFLAYDPEIDRHVAVKTVQIFASLPEADRAQARERFLREARSAGKLLHPGIVTIFDVGEADGLPYIAMEFVEGETLDTFCLRPALLPVPAVVAAVTAVAEALGFAHARGIVHRDIKPANLMRVGDRHVKIMDFGLAKSAATSVTQDSALFGTPSYMSPEQVRGEPLDGRTDLFSLGVVCQELLTGVKPFGGESISSVLYRIVHEPPKDASAALDRVSPSLVAFLAKALAKSRDDRFRDGASFASALRQAGASSLDGTVDPPSKPEPSSPTVAVSSASPAATPSVPRSPRSRLPWVAAATVGALLIGWGVVSYVAPRTVPVANTLRARVRTEPPGVPVRLNAAPLESGTAEFSGDGPFGVLTANQGCREAKHRLEASDAGGEIVLVLDPARAEVVVDPGVPGARISVNGQDVGIAPASIDLDLCRDNAIEVGSDGYRPTIATIPAKAMPLEARNVAAAIKLEAIPKGRLVFPATRVPVVFTVDGQPAERNQDGLELSAGPHDIRATNEARFVDVTARLDVPAGETVTPQLSIPALGRLVVQTFPPNCRVALKRPGSDWRPLGEAPLQYELAAGRYALRVEAPTSDESREQEITVTPGSNAPVRISFGRTGR